MKQIYKGCEIEVFRTGQGFISFSIFDGSYEVTSSFTESSDTVRTIMKHLKEIVDDYRIHPEDYEQ